jgi:hypothetical protein
VSTAALDGRGESERLDQEWAELLEELRVLLPGSEVLFAFLLGVPFTQRFGEVTGADRTVYTVAFLAAGAATLLLVAPGVHHRLLWRRHYKPIELKIATAFAIAGAFWLAMAVACVVYVVMHVLYDNHLPALTTAGTALLTVCGWYLVPLVLRLLKANSAPPARRP